MRIHALLFLALATTALPACALAPGPAPASLPASAPSASSAPRSSESPRNPKMITARVIGPDGKLTSAKPTPRVELSDAEWKLRLTPEQHAIARAKGTERPFCGGLLNNKGEGVYACVGCALPLFESSAKFESGSGWPSFFTPVGPTNVAEKPDRSHGMVRTEILCPRCDAHLGHVFDDGPAPTGKRYCLNSEILRFIPKEEMAAHAE